MLAMIAAKVAFNLFYNSSVFLLLLNIIQKNDIQ